jgi:hypothetical protein
MPAGLLIPSQTTALIVPPQPRKLLKLRAWGITANNADTKTLKFYVGATNFSIALTTNTGNAWQAEMEYMSKDNTHQIARFLCMHGTAILSNSELTNGGDDLTTALVAKITATASVGNANDIVVHGAVVEFWV